MQADTGLKCLSKPPNWALCQCYGQCLHLKGSSNAITPGPLHTDMTCPIKVSNEPGWETCMLCTLKSKPYYLVSGDSNILENEGAVQEGNVVGVWRERGAESFTQSSICRLRKCAVGPIAYV